MYKNCGLKASHVDVSSSKITLNKYARKNKQEKKSQE